MQTTPERSSPLAGQLGRLSGAFVAGGGDFWTRALEIGTRYLRSAVAIATSPDGRAPRALLDEYRHFLVEIAAVPGLALERAAAELAFPAAGAPAAAMVPPIVTVQGKPVARPLRVLDAAQGQALYSIGVGDAQAILDQQGVPFAAVDLGRNRTTLLIYAAQFRASDLGAYAEMGFGLLVAPWTTPRAPGIYFFAMPVTSAFSSDAVRTIWGYAKRVDEIDIALEDGRMTCSLTRAGGSAPLLSFVVPRGGGGSSTAIPFRTYTMLDGRPHRTVVVRTGRGERWRAGGDGVALTLGDARANDRDPLWQALRSLRVAEARPILHGWTEHMAAEFLAAVLHGGPDMAPKPR